MYCLSPITAPNRVLVGWQEPKQRIFLLLLLVLLFDKREGKETTVALSIVWSTDQKSSTKPFLDTRRLSVRCLPNHAFSTFSEILLVVLLAHLYHCEVWSTKCKKGGHKQPCWVSLSHQCSPNSSVPIIPAIGIASNISKSLMSQRIFLTNLTLEMQLELQLWLSTKGAVSGLLIGILQPPNNSFTQNHPIKCKFSQMSLL